jgi:multiple sugar transport system substrate-binding protein
MGDLHTRRDFLRLTAAAAVVATGAAACGSGSDKQASRSDEREGGTADSDRTLRIAQWAHFIPAYDAWFDGDYAKRWGEEYGVEVLVDHIPVADIASRADAEVAARGPHDIFGFVDPPAIYEDEVIDHKELVEDVAARLGKMTPLMERSIVNPRTGKYFGFPDYWVANVVHYRRDVWDRVERGLAPASWEDLLRWGPKLKAMGHPLGIGSSTDVDSNYSLLGLLHAYGSSVQDEEGNVAIDNPATVEAVERAAVLFGTGTTEDVFLWDASSNNRLLASGKGSLILNAVSAIRAVEDQDPELAANIMLAPVPTSGPAGDRPRGFYVTGVNVIWKFSRHQDLAKQFLIDLASQQREAFVRSRFYNLPAFPGAVPDLATLTGNDAGARPPGKYALLADAASWSTNIGHPGHANAAVDETFRQFIIPKMFAAAAKGELSAKEAVANAEAEMKPIFEKWKERGKI